MTPLIYLGIWVLPHAAKFDRVMVSLNQLESRRSDFKVGRWILDSGAFTRITSGRGHLPASEYAAQIRRWAECGELAAAVCQDWMCEPFVTTLTGQTVLEHQRRTSANWRELAALDTGGVYVMPVIQGFHPHEYAAHVDELAPDLPEGAWVGVGSVCKRQGRPEAILSVLGAIRSRRPDLRLHGFGVKTTALMLPDVAERLYSVDSMAWSFAARYGSRDPHARNCWKTAAAWLAHVENLMEWQRTRPRAGRLFEPEALEV